MAVSPTSIGEKSGTWGAGCTPSEPNLLGSANEPDSGAEARHAASVFLPFESIVW